MASRNEFENLIALAKEPEATRQSPDALIVNDPINPAGCSRNAVISFISGGDLTDVSATADDQLLLSPDILDDLAAQAEAGIDEERAVELEIQRLAEAARQLADLINHRRAEKRRNI